MPRILEYFIDLMILGPSGPDLIIGLSDAKPVDNVKWRSLRNLGDYLLRDIGFERPASIVTRRGRISLVHKKTSLLSKAILAGLFLALPVSIAHASNRTTILGYICATYESARQVALERSWERPESMPADCRTLFTRDPEERFAEISEIIEVLPIGDDRWVEIGKVRRNLVETGYSAGFSEQLLLF